jgi:hypothetical protein
VRTLTFWLRPAFVLRVLNRFQLIAGFDRAMALAAASDGTLIVNGTTARSSADSCPYTTGRHRTESDAVAATPVRAAAEFDSRRLATHADDRVAPELSRHARTRPSCVGPPRRFEFARHPAMQPVEDAVALTQTQLATAIADRAQLSKTEAKRALAALDEVVLDELGAAENVRIGGLVQLTV